MLDLGRRRLGIGLCIFVRWVSGVSSGRGAADVQEKRHGRGPLIGVGEMPKLGEEREGGRTHIRVVYALNTDGSEDLLNPVFSPLHLLPVNGD